MRSTTISTSPTRARRSRAALVLGLSLAWVVAAAASLGPRDVVQRLADQVLGVLKDKTLSSDAKRGKIEPLVYANVDFDTLSRLVLARNWQSFSSDEQAKFEQEFRQHLSVTYGNSVDSYKNEEVQITGDREEARGDWTVKSKILRGGPDDVEIDYRLRQAGGEWKIIDFVVEGVSLVANFRSQFQDILSSNSPAQLIALLHDKNAKGESIVKEQPKKS